MEYKKLYFSGHATMQMFKRNILVEDVEKVLKSGNIIKEYPEDKPYPSFLVLNIVNKRPIHVVASIDSQENCFVITAYEPDKNLWDNNFTIKK